LAAGTPHWTPLAKISALPQIPWLDFVGGERRENGGQRKGEERKGTEKVLRKTDAPENVCKIQCWQMFH